MPELPKTAKGQRRLALVGLLLLVLVCALTVFRIARAHQIPGPFNPARQGFCDFQNGVYFPALAFREGVSPYGQAYARDYPVERSIPFFSPVILAAHVPFTWLPLKFAEVAYFVWMLLLVLGIASCATKWVSSVWRWDLVAITALAIVSMRGGQQTLFTGYFTFEIVLATLIAVQYGGTRPTLSALALTFVSAKPNYLLPIALLMAFRGNYKAVVLGGVLSATLASLAFLWILPDGGVTELADQIRATQQIHRGDVVERPVNTWTRIDALAIVAKWLVWDPDEAMYFVSMLVFLLPAGLLLWKERGLRNSSSDASKPQGAGSATDISGALILLTSLVAVYHHVYDTLILIPVTLAAIQATSSDWQRLKPHVRGLLWMCWLLPGLNYCSSQKFLDAWAIDGLPHKLLTSLNAFGLLLSWLALLYVAASRLKRKSA